MGYLGLQLAERPVAEAMLLGTPIRAGVGVDRALASKRDDLVTLTGRLALLPAHTALFLLRNALAIPKLFYILPAAPCSDSLELAAYDEVVRNSLSSILNLTLPPLTWSQACLPVKWGGIGVRSAHQRAPSAFLASAAGVAVLLSLLLPSCILSIEDSESVRSEAAWRRLRGVVVPL